ncbi:hypothetical protein L7F22_043754 [Adiantum nelumboides]|nr:hypothetical protein [Adiantum nelumboides]
MSLEPGWAWVEGDDWRIDWIGKWSPVGVDAEGFVYTDTDWQTPSPYPYGHAGNPRYPPAIQDSQANGSIFGELLTGHSKEVSSVFEDDDEEEDHQGPESLTGMEIRAVKADTRRRRWLRRAVWIGKEEIARSD